MAITPLLVRPLDPGESLALKPEGCEKRTQNGGNAWFRISERLQGMVGGQKQLWGDASDAATCTRLCAGEEQVVVGSAHRGAMMQAQGRGVKPHLVVCAESSPGGEGG